MELETIRTFILIIGWPVLIVGSLFFLFQAFKFYKKLQKLALGKLIVTSTIGTIISMIALGIVATFYMFCELKMGVIVVVPIFFIWLVVMVIVYSTSNKWAQEAVKINILYYKIKERTKQLEQEKNKLSHVASNMSTGSILLDTGGKVMFINKEAKNIIGFDSNDEEEILGALYQKFAKHDLKKAVNRCIKGHPSNILNAEVGHNVYEIFLRCLSDHSSKGEAFFGYFIWIRDVTNEIRLENTKNRFITVASHKLRTPLSEIRSSLDLLKDKKLGNFNTEQTKLLAKLTQASNSMLGMVSELLQVIESDTKEINPKLTPVKIKTLVKSTSSNLADICKEKKCEIILKDSKDYQIKTDKKLLRKIVYSILENAVLYSETKKDVYVELTDKKGNLIIKIQDNGIGIPKSNHANVFDKFSRAENAIKAFPDGTGVSLHMAKKIIDSLSGEIWFESDEDKGTTFFLSLPL